MIVSYPKIPEEVREYLNSYPLFQSDKSDIIKFVRDPICLDFFRTISFAYAKNYKSFKKYQIQTFLKPTDIPENTYNNVIPITIATFFPHNKIFRDDDIKYLNMENASILLNIIEPHYCRIKGITSTDFFKDCSKAILEEDELLTI